MAMQIISSTVPAQNFDLFRRASFKRQRSTLKLTSSVTRSLKSVDTSSSPTELTKKHLANLEQPLQKQIPEPINQAVSQPNGPKTPSSAILTLTLPMVRPFYAVKCNPDPALLGSLAESNLVFPTPVSESDHSVLEQPSVFETGKFHPITSYVGTASSCSPPKPLLIVRPEEQGTYPVILFHHGTACQNSWYTDVFSFISSHGFIVVAPQLYDLIPPSGQGELDLAAKVANWLPSGLRCVLPENIEGDLQNLALAGHSRGGYIAFALALGLADVSLEVNFSALIGVDPVAGTSKNDQLEPKILDHESCSFNISIPVAIIGTGLGNKTVFPLLPTCAPDGVSHTEIFNECRPPCSHFVITDYGHMDVLDDDIGLVGGLARVVCKGSGSGVSRDPMRKTVGGIFVAFLEAFFNGNYTKYNNILQKPNYFAPATLDPVQNKSEGTSVRS